MKHVGDFGCSMQWLFFFGKLWNVVLSVVQIVQNSKKLVNRLVSGLGKQIVWVLMETGHLKRNFNQLLKSEGDIEKVYDSYTKLVDKEVNLSGSEHPTHQICWIERNALKEKLDQMTFVIAKIFSRPPHSPSRNYKFKTSHVLSDEGLVDLQDSIDRGDQMETLTSFLAGIFFWLFFLSIPLLPVLGTTFIVLPILSILIFSISVLRLSSARYRYLPPLFRSISADHWGIKSIQKIHTQGLGDCDPA